jgi:hypothetical protein
MAAQKGIKMRKMFSIRWLLFAVFLLGISAASYAQIGIGISVGFAPPELPVYEQPLCPGDGYIWTPGYWAYDDNEGDYYWVPGTWVEAPQVGYLWTPPYWGYEGGYRFHEGYWGPQVGFYGGISYGFGYFGNGYEGGRWDHDHFYYNRSVNNVNVNVVHNTYNTTVINNNTNINRVSYNGGNGGVNARPSSQQQAVAQERHVGPVAAQQQHIQTARTNPELRASTNHGAPPIAATARPAAFSGQGVVAGRNGGTPYTPPANRGGNNNNANARPANNNAPNNNNGGGGNANRPPTANNAPNNNNTHNADRPPTASTNSPSNNSSNANRPNSYSHVKELPPVERPPAPNTGNPKLDQKYEQQQQKVFAKQDQQRQQLAAKQEQDHQRLAQQQASQQKQQQVEQRHQQQTQQLQQQHTQQVQKLQQRQQPPPQQHQAPPPQQQQQHEQKH